MKKNLILLSLILTGCYTLLDNSKQMLSPDSSQDYPAMKYSIGKEVHLEIDKQLYHVGDTAIVNIRNESELSIFSPLYLLTTVEGYSNGQWIHVWRKKIPPNVRLAPKKLPPFQTLTRKIIIHIPPQKLSKCSKFRLVLPWYFENRKKGNNHRASHSQEFNVK